MHAGADADDRSRALVADDVGNARERADLAVHEVAAFDGDRLDADQDLARAACGVGDVLVAKHFGTAVGVVDSCFHFSRLVSLE
ncbi:hypothetical protein [Variovorax sp. E3]|uniref:hypothetical protein n=1 Tax=Variovorax sp. E3 TaxID=1914993 RepID=UPI0027DC5AF2|nr:hypothetical protein [Variovorax sp. E3]